MSPIRQGRIFIWLLLFSAITTLIEVNGHPHGGNIEEPSVERTNAVRMTPRREQKQWFRTFLRDNKLGSNSKMPRQAVNELPRVIAAILEGIGGTFFSANPWLQGAFSSFITSGWDTFVSLFKSSEQTIVLPNMPPVIRCSKSISKYQDPGRKSAIVTWQSPTASDVEDGIITHKIEQTTGGDSGSRFSGRDIISYRVVDSQGRTDTCSFEVSVKLIKCPIPSVPTQVETNCTFVTYLGETCAFSCKVGYTRSGPTSVTCGEQQRYDKPYPECRINKCPKPDLPHGGKKWDCSDSYNYGSVCTIDCGEGFRVARTHDRAPWNVASIKCQADRTWNHMPMCKDVSAPTIENCPGFNMEYADRGKNSTIVTWPEIIARDTSGGNVTITQTKGLPSGSRFEVGAHEITYEAVDEANLKDVCMFFVNIDVRSCPVPKMTHRKLDMNCIGQFTHGSACIVTCRQGIELKGSSRITCEAVNGSMEWSMPGGTPTCLEKPCVKLADPPNARLDCSEYSGGNICYVKCIRNHIPARNVMYFTASTCSPATGIWKNADHPGCVEQRIPTSIESNLLFYWKTECVENDTENVTSTFRRVLSKNTFIRDCSQCRVKNVRSSCVRRPKYNIMAVRWSVSHSFEEGYSKDYLENKLTGVGILMKNWLKQNFMRLSLKNVGEKTRFKFKGNENTVTCDAKYKPNHKDLVCAACAPGYVFDGKDGCEKCPIGTYQDDSGPTCIPCPVGRETIGPGKTDEIDCKAPCKMGRYSETGLTPCRECPVGQYQMRKRSKMCESCPEGHITASTGSVKEEDCYPPSGKVLRLGTIGEGAHYIQLKWIRPAETNGDLEGYDVEYHKSSEDWQSRVFVTAPGNKTEGIEISGLEPNTEYVFSVWAVTEKGRGIERQLIASTLNDTDATEESRGIERQWTTTTQLNDIETTPDPTLCPPGTNSYDGKKEENGTCTLCSIGFYQDMAGQDFCKVCDADLVTWYEGSTSERDCVESSWTTPTTTTTLPPTTTAAEVPCDPGYVSKTGFKPGCRQCPDTKIPKKNRKSCKWCKKEKGVHVCPSTVQPTDMTTKKMEETTESNDEPLTDDDVNRTDRGGTY